MSCWIHQHCKPICNFVVFRGRNDCQGELPEESSSRLRTSAICAIVLSIYELRPLMADILTMRGIFRDL